jgi:hypothetical protein
MPSIFISYRRSDSQDVAGRIYDRLAQHFGKEAIFKDVDDIPGGEDFRIFLQTTLQQCKVVLAIIGPDWVNARDEQGRRRLDNPADWVRVEIEEALRRDDVLVLPVLVSNAQMPLMNELPERMQNLVYRNYRLARPDPDFHTDINRLIIDLERHVEQTRPLTESPAMDIDTSQQCLDNYRDQVRQYLKADNGALTPVSRGILNGLRSHFDIADTEARAVEQEEQQPYQKKAEAIANYRKVFANTLKYEFPPSEGTRQRLMGFKQLLKLSDNEIADIEAPLLHTAEVQQRDKAKEEYEEKLNLYQQEFSGAVQAEYPLSHYLVSRRFADLQLKAEKLSSERFGAKYYAKLRDLLVAQDWEAADKETARCMCEVMDRQQEGWLRVEDIENFPCLDLRNIDHLWVRYSQGKFGFSVQKKIWRSCGSPNLNSGRQDWEKFGTMVGWRSKGLFGMGADWLRYPQLTFDGTAPKGHLPKVRVKSGEDDLSHGGRSIGKRSACVLFARQDL